MLKLLLSRQDERKNPGARLTGIVAVLMIAVYAVRATGSLLQFGGALFEATNAILPKLGLRCGRWRGRWR